VASILEQLIENLEEENKVYEELIECSKSKKTAIIGNRIEEIRSVTAKENTLVGKCTRINKDREKIFSDIRYVMNIKPNENLTVKRIAELVEGQNGSDRLIAARENAVSLLSELKNLNDINGEMINFSIEHIEFSINVLRGAKLNQTTYLDSSGNEIYSNKSFFDTKQ
jgi:flagellar biosynthesis/type III secretory pathway chaperone